MRKPLLYTSISLNSISETSGQPFLSENRTVRTTLNSLKLGAPARMLLSPAKPVKGAHKSFRARDRNIRINPLSLGYHSIIRYSDRNLSLRVGSAVIDDTEKFSSLGSSPVAFLTALKIASTGPEPVSETDISSSPAIIVTLASGEASVPPE